MLKETAPHAVSTRIGLNGRGQLWFNRLLSGFWLYKVSGRCHSNQCNQNHHDDSTCIHCQSPGIARIREKNSATIPVDPSSTAALSPALYSLDEAPPVIHETSCVKHHV